MLSVTISQSSQAFLGLCGFSVVETFAGKRWWVVSLRMVLVSRMVATHGDLGVFCSTFLFHSIFVSHLSESEEGRRDNLTGGLSGG